MIVLSFCASTVVLRSLVIWVSAFLDCLLRRLE